MPVGDVLPEITLVLAAVVVLMAASFVEHGRHGVCALIALVGLGAAAGLTVSMAASPPALAFSGTWALDRATSAARLTILGFAGLSILLSPDWMRTDRRHGEFYAVMLLSALGAVLMAGATDLMELVVGVLLSSITGFTLAAYHRNWALSVEAGMKYFLIGALANALLVTGVILLFGLTGDTTYPTVAQELISRAETAPGTDWGATAAFAFLAMGLAYKLAAFPAHSWLPDVAEGSPAPAAAFLTVVPKVGALVALVRITGLVPGGLIPWTGLVAGLSVATMTIGNLGALWQTDVRRLIGWSSVAQSGYALVAVVALGRSPLALPALLFFLVSYGVANLTAFAVVTHLRGQTALQDYRGLAHGRPLTAAALVVAFLSLVGVPPLAGFVGKLAVFGAAIDAGFGWLALVAVANTVASLFYYLRVLGPVYFDSPSEPERTPRLGPWSGWAMAMAVLATVGVGLAAEAVWVLLPLRTLLSS